MQSWKLLQWRQYIASKNPSTRLKALLGMLRMSQLAVPAIGADEDEQVAHYHNAYKQGERNGSDASTVIEELKE